MFIVRVDGKFISGSIVPAGQAVLHFLLHSIVFLILLECYRLVYKLQSEETVSDELVGCIE